MKHTKAVMAWCLMMVCGAWAMAGSAWADKPHKRVIQVLGQAELEVNPDVVDLRFTLQTEKKTPKLAVQALAAQEKVVLATLKKAGMALNDVQISYISLYPRFKYVKSFGSSSRNRVLSGYQASKTYVACVRDVSKMAHFVSALASAKVSSFSTSFRSTKIPTHKKQLRAMAVAAAKAKASELAKLSGVALGAVWSIEEVTGRAYAMSNSFGYRRRSSSLRARPGAIKLRLSVRIVYTIK